MKFLSRRWAWLPLHKDTVRFILLEGRSDQLDQEAEEEEFENLSKVQEQILSLYDKYKGQLKTVEEDLKAAQTRIKVLESASDLT